MREKYRNFGIVALIIIIIGLFSGLVWGNIVSIRQNPVEKEFLVPWLGMRTFLESGNNPYGDSAAQRAQVFYYGNLANSNEDPLELGQPFSGEILFFPLALIKDYTTARVIWMVLLELALLGSAILSLYLFEWKLPTSLMALYALVVVLGAQSFLPLLENNKVILLSVFLLTGLVFLQKELDELGGAFLALSFFQPSATGILCLITFWWAIRCHRWRVIWGMLMTVGFLFIVSFALLPGWFLPFIQSFRVEFPFSGYMTTYRILTKMWPAIGNKVALGLTIGTVIILLMELRSRNNRDFRWFMWLAMLSLAINSLPGIPLLKVNIIFLLLPMTYILKVLSQRLKPKNRWMYIGSLLGISLIGSWGFKFGILFFHGVIASNLINTYFPSLLIIVGLFWVRWWAIHPFHTWMDKIKSEQE